MRVVVPGLGEVALTKRHFVAQGAEGAIYGRDGLAYKIYHQRDRVIPAGKLQELTGLTHPNVVRPEQMITDVQGRDVGFVMPLVEDTWPLCRLFTRGFRDRHGLTWPDIMGLVAGMADTLAEIHAAGMCVVDLNDLNLRVREDFGTVFFIDVDSWQTPRYPATAITDSIADPHADTGVFNVGTDWFAFAVVSFQMLMGIHPYKGKHPTVHGLQARMAQDISVFHSDVQLPAACTPLDALPPDLRDWFVATFEHRQRTPPPVLSGRCRPPVARPVTTTRSTALQVTQLGHFDAPVLGVWTHRGDRYVATRDGVFRNAHRIAPAPAGRFSVGFSSRRGRPVIASLQGDQIQLQALDPAQSIPFDMHVRECCDVDGRLIARVGEQLLEIVLQDLGDGVVATPRPIANVLRHATTLYDGVAIQDLVGETWAVLVIRGAASQTIRLPELDGVQVIDARFDGGVLMVTGQSEGALSRWVFRIDPDLSYDVRQVAESIPFAPAFVTLDSGVCICRTEEETLTVFHARPGIEGMKTVTDASIAGDIRLAREPGRLLVVQDTRLLQVSLLQASAA
jgi:hypothetical protein